MSWHPNRANESKSEKWRNFFGDDIVLLLPLLLLLMMLRTIFALHSHLEVHFMSAWRIYSLVYHLHIVSHKSSVNFACSKLFRYVCKVAVGFFGGAYERFFPKYMCTLCVHFHGNRELLSYQPWIGVNLQCHWCCCCWHFVYAPSSGKFRDIVLSLSLSRSRSHSSHIHWFAILQQMRGLLCIFINMYARKIQKIYFCHVLFRILSHAVFLFIKQCYCYQHFQIWSYSYKKPRNYCLQRRFSLVCLCVYACACVYNVNRMNWDYVWSDEGREKKTVERTEKNVHGIHGIQMYAYIFICCE